MERVSDVLFGEGNLPAHRLPDYVFRAGRDLRRVAKKFHQPVSACLSGALLEERRCRFHNSNLFCHGDSDPLVQRHAVLLGQTLGGLLNGQGKLQGIGSFTHRLTFFSSSAGLRTEMPNRSPASTKSPALYVTKASAWPLTAASSTISSFGSRDWGRQRKCSSTGSIKAASSARNSSISSGASPCARRCSGRCKTSSYSRKSGGFAKSTSCRSAINRRTAFPAPVRVRSPATTTEVSRTILRIM